MVVISNTGGGGDVDAATKSKSKIKNDPGHNIGFQCLQCQPKTILREGSDICLCPVRVPKNTHIIADLEVEGLEPILDPLPEAIAATEFIERYFSCRGGGRETQLDCWCRCGCGCGCGCR